MPFVIPTDKVSVVSSWDHTSYCCSKMNPGITTVEAEKNLKTGRTWRGEDNLVTRLSFKLYNVFKLKMNGVCI